MKIYLGAGLLACAMSVGAAERGDASVVMAALEIGNDVVITASGTYDFSGLVADGGNPFFVATGINPGLGVLNFASFGISSYDCHLGASVVPFGTGGSAGTPDVLVHNGDVFSLQSDGSVGGTVGTTTGTVDTTMTFSDVTFDTLGMDEGTYIWSWAPPEPDGVPVSAFAVSNDIEQGRGVILTIGEAEVIPVPASLPLLLAGLGAVALVRRRKG